MKKNVNTFVALLRKATPKIFLDYFRFKRRVRRLAKIRNNSSSIRISSFKEIICSLGINSNSTIFIHSGSDWLGKVDGGTFSVVRDLLEYFDQGTVVMPSFPMEGMAEDYLKNNTFSVKKTASKMGLITEIFRRCSGVKRSLHPTHSVCALGANSEYLTSSHEECKRPFERLSPFGKLAELKGKILLIGVDTSVLTHVHVVEDALGSDFPFKVYSKKIYIAKVLDDNDKEVIVNTFVHNPSLSIRKNIVKFEPEFIEKGVMTVKDILGVRFRLIDAAKLEDFLYTKAKRGITIYD